MSLSKVGLAHPQALCGAGRGAHLAKRAKFMKPYGIRNFNATPIRFAECCIDLFLRRGAECVLTQDFGFRKRSYPCDIPTKDG